jgi:hypothetical protein
VVVGFLGAGDGGDDGGEVEFHDHARIRRLGRALFEEQALHAAVAFDEGAVGGGASGHAQVGDGFGVDGEEAGGGAVFGGHVGEDGAVGERQAGAAGAEVLDELSDDVVLAQELGDDEGEVGGGDAGAEGAAEADAGDDGGEQGDGLAEHGGLGLDAADAPAEHAEAVDHGGVRIGADEGVGIGQEGAVGLRLGMDAVGEEFEVDLVADADAGRDDAQFVEGLLAPAEELVALAVAVEFNLHVALRGRRGWRSSRAARSGPRRGRRARAAR